MTDFHGKVALVTGGSSGIGLAAARAFSLAGARVVITGRRQQAIDEAIETLGENAVGVSGDIADLAHHDALMALIEKRFGSLDIYMANAGMNHIEDTSEVTADSYDVQFGANTRGVFFGVQKALPLLSNGGTIILTSSIASEKVLAGHAVYAGTKAAINAFARNWAIELKDREIRVNVLSPGPVDTAILAKLGIPYEQRPAFERSMAEAIPLGRMGEANELAQAALFLASDAASFVNGVNLRVDGGMTLL
ncbi:glucose 1-dehydrogenase [Salinisphaera sp. T31B1]|uniref:SDR family NAD(P)-dependent oxidoreductase n=1 Tax=Salinisphaera sp. T31B1 TaxID=727963 RepID=UPI003341B629